ncbi:MAG: DNA repair protein RadC [Fimbriimonadaceae bacterium]|nr:DNA repair protein RadC [Fimbriimonadaceae bacterium]
MERNESPWVRIQHHGLKAVSVIDLLSLCLSREEADVERNEGVARDLVKRYPAGRLSDVSPRDLLNAVGLEQFESQRMLAGIELGRRIAGAGKKVTEEISTAEQAYELFAYLADEPREHFCIASLNTKNKVLAVRTIHIGTLNASLVGAREVFREALRENASHIILAHNHPSGDPTPSPEDISVTKKLKALGQELDIIVIDHLVIGQGSFVSMARQGQL